VADDAGVVVFGESDDPDDEDAGHELSRAREVSLTLDGMQHLLKLRALSALHLPWISDAWLSAIRILAEATAAARGHVLTIERIVPLSRNRLQRHWIEADRDVGEEDG